MNINFAKVSGCEFIMPFFVTSKLPVTMSPCHYEQRMKFIGNLRNLDNTLLNQCDDDLVNILLYESSKYSFSTSNKIMSLTIECLESVKHFGKPLI